MIEGKQSAPGSAEIHLMLHTADDFAEHFYSKVSKIRSSTLFAHPAITQPRTTANLSVFRPVTVSEITKIIMNSRRNIIHSIQFQHGLSSSSVRFWRP